jgi:hypothetical protein
LHEDDDQSCERLIENDGSDDGERRDDVGGEMSATRGPKRLPDERGAGDDEPHLPDDVSRVCAMAQREGDADGDRRENHENMRNGRADHREPPACLGLIALPGEG